MKPVKNTIKSFMVLDKPVWPMSRNKIVTVEYIKDNEVYYTYPHMDNRELFHQNIDFFNKSTKEIP